MDRVRRGLLGVADLHALLQRCVAVVEHAAFDAAPEQDGNGQGGWRHAASDFVHCGLWSVA
jgi:hypothetical protein